MDTSANQPPASRPFWMRLTAIAMRHLAMALILGLWIAVALSNGQTQMALITASIAISLLYLLFWAFRMLLSRKARLAFKGEGRTFIEGVVPMLMLWLGWALSDVGSHLHDIFLGVSVLATIFFCIGAYAAYATTPREGETIYGDLSDMDGCAEGCLEVILSSFLGR